LETQERNKENDIWWRGSFACLVPEENMLKEKVFSSTCHPASQRLHTNEYFFCPHMQAQFSWSERGPVNPQVVGLILSKSGNTNSQRFFEHIELPANLLDYFLQSDKSNINQ